MTTLPQALAIGTPLPSVRIHPLVLFNVLDHFMRRNENIDTVIGTLLGSTTSEGVIEVKSSFPVPHTELGDNVAVDIEFHKTLLELHQRVHPKEVIVGWYATGDVISDKTALIHSFYGNEVSNAVHLMIDTTLKNDRMDIGAYISTGVTVGDKTLGSTFTRVKVDLRSSEAEKVGADMFGKAKGDPNGEVFVPLNDIEALESSVRRLVDLLDTLSTYVNDVVEGRVEADNKVGRALAETVSSVPIVPAALFDKMFNNSIQDLLMATHIANITRTQTILQEKLQQSNFAQLASAQYGYGGAY